MKSFFSILWIGFFLTMWAGCKTTMETTESKKVQPTHTPEYIFPDDWIGVWKGPLFLENLQTGSKRELKTELHISETDTAGQWTWTIVYDDGDKIHDERKYLLIAQDSTYTHFIVDEKNSILLDQYRIGNYMLSRFSVDNSLLFVNHRLKGNYIESEIFSGETDNPIVTGESLADSIPVNKIMSYPIGFMQRSVMYKQ